MIPADRTARLVSLHRRTGSQLTYDELMGRTPRHARTWRDLQSDDTEHLRVARGAVIGSVIGGVLWAVCVLLMLHI